MRAQDHSKYVPLRLQFRVHSPHAMLQGAAMSRAPSVPTPVPGVYAFEEIDEALRLVPLAARRTLDALGCKLPLEGWLSLPLDDRRRLVAAGAGEHVDVRVEALLERATPRGSRIPRPVEPDAASVPASLSSAVGSAALDDRRWRELRALDRYVLARYAASPEKLARACAEILGVTLAHLTSAGEAHMMDVGKKPETRRRAVASACVRTTREVLAAIDAARPAPGEAPRVPALPKGDVLAAARIAGILAAKRTPDLVPLCHPVRTTRAAVEFETDHARGELRVRAVVEAVDRTGVEMEAMVAAAVAALTVYDMIKSADRWATIDQVRLEAKSGGKSGDVSRPPERG
jgi:cyclic pyranopterin phosphate synthase